MNETFLLERLEDIAHRLGVELRYEDLGLSGIRCEGGLCKVAGKPLILINRKDSRRRKILVLSRSLRKFDLEGIFIPPAVRKALDA
jgi:hypothetical protein